MGLPSQKRSRTSKRTRASHFALAKKPLNLCSHCKKAVATHRVCANCGYYKGKEVVKMKVKTKKQKS